MSSDSAYLSQYSPTVCWPSIASRRLPCNSSEPDRLHSGPGLLGSFASQVWVGDPGGGIYQPTFFAGRTSFFPGAGLGARLVYFVLISSVVTVYQCNTITQCSVSSHHHHQQNLLLLIRHIFLTSCQAACLSVCPIHNTTLAAMLCLLVAIWFGFFTFQTSTEHRQHIK